jgi:hypothetical protein
VTEQQRIWRAYLRQELPEEERVRVQQQIVEVDGYAEALAEFEYDEIDAAARRRVGGDRAPILAIAAMVFCAVVWTLWPGGGVPVVFLAAGTLRDEVGGQRVRIPRGGEVIFELELPEPPPRGRCEARGQVGDCSGKVFRLRLPRPAAGKQEIELRHGNELVSVYEFTVE